MGGGGAGAKDYVRATRSPKSLTAAAGVQGSLIIKGHWKLSGFLILSRAI